MRLGRGGTLPLFPVFVDLLLLLILRALRWFLLLRLSTPLLSRAPLRLAIPGSLVWP